jgi:hypothetical protein
MGPASTVGIAHRPDHWPSEFLLALRTSTTHQRCSTIAGPHHWLPAGPLLPTGGPPLDIATDSPLVPHRRPERHHRILPLLTTSFLNLVNTKLPSTHRPSTAQPGGSTLPPPLSIFFTLQTN